jgi:hypothetical protein
MSVILCRQFLANDPPLKEPMRTGHIFYFSNGPFFARQKMRSNLKFPWYDETTTTTKFPR